MSNSNPNPTTRFKKGHKKIPRKIGRPSERDRLLNAVRKIEKEQKINFWEAVAKIALKSANEGRDATLLKEVMKKLIPDMQAIQHSGEDGPIQVQIIANPQGILSANKT